jgi:hypothetical protein
MAVIIDEVLTEAAAPATTPLQGQPVTQVPGDTEADARRVAAMIRRREARAARLRAD